MGDDLHVRTQSRLLDALLDAWDRNNTILVNLLRLIPSGGLDARATPSSPTIAQLFTHIHFVRLALLHENAPELAPDLPEEQWAVERDRERISTCLNESARAVRAAVRARVEAGLPTDLHYDHPLLLLQHLLWHEGYHHGQMKLALKLDGRPLSDNDAGPLTWDVWTRRTTGDVT